jgi:hypothetical protein
LEYVHHSNLAEAVVLSMTYNYNLLFYE